MTRAHLEILPSTEADALEGRGTLVCHATAIQETDYDVKECHIARLSKNNTKACFIQQAHTKLKCIQRIVKNRKNIHVPTYSKMLYVVKTNKL